MGGAGLGAARRERAGVRVVTKAVQLLGLALVVAGAAIWSPPVALVLAGVLLVLVAELWES